jgi:hypothetical protein
VPNGSATVDSCGTCDDDNSNDCTQDCAGTWGGNADIGTYYLDLDGDGAGSGDANIYCSAFVPSGWVGNNNDLEPDCATDDTDGCGECGGDNSTCADCAGTPNGSAYYDNCNECDANISNDCVPDCLGAWGGNAVVDDCGVCTGDGSSCHRPIANGLHVQVYEDSTIVFNLLATDPDDDPLIATISDSPNDGEVVITSIAYIINTRNYNFTIIWGIRNSGY